MNLALLEMISNTAHKFYHPALFNTQFVKYRTKRKILNEQIYLSLKNDDIKTYDENNVFSDYNNDDAISNHGYLSN